VLDSTKLKAKIGIEALPGVKTINNIAQEFGIHPVLVSQWKKRFRSKRRACSRVSEGQSFPPSTRNLSACIARSANSRWS